MQAIINGKKYNTDTGQCICQTVKGYLYRKYNSLEYFLCDRHHKTITPVSFREAKELCNKYGTKEQYDSMFVPSKADGFTIMRIPKSDYTKLRDCAQHHGRTLKAEYSAIIDKAWRNLDRHK